MSICCLLLCGTARASEVLTEEQWNALNTQQLEQAADGYVEQPLDSSIDFNEALEALLSKGAAQIKQIIRTAVGGGTVLLTIVLFCSVGQALCRSSGMTWDPTEIAGVVAITAVSLNDVTSLIGMGRETIDRIAEFSNLLIPVMTAAATASGNITGATVRQMATLLCADVLVTLIDRVLLPFVYLYTAACAAAAAAGNPGIQGVAKLIRWMVTTVLTTILTLFTGYLSISGAMAGSADRVALKLTRSAISGMVPVVGSILSDATETVLAGAGILRNSIGVFGVLAVLGFCLTPFLTLCIQYLMYKVVSVLSATMSSGRLPGLIGEIGSAFGLVLGMTGAAALLVTISLIFTISVAVT